MSSQRAVSIKSSIFTALALMLAAGPARADLGWAEPPPPRWGDQVAAPTPTPEPVALAGRQDPYRTPGIVIAGVGLGGLMISSGGAAPAVTPSYLLHLGLAMGAAEFALRVNLAPEALTLPAAGGERGERGDGGELAVGIYASRATFNYRFLPRSTVHPVVGAGLEMIAASPSRGDDGYAFAGTARLGLELAFPLSDGALALGLDATGHLPFTRTEDFAVDLKAMLGFGAYVDYRF